MTLAWMACGEVRALCLAAVTCCTVSRPDTLMWAVAAVQIGRLLDVGLEDGGHGVDGTIVWGKRLMALVWHGRKWLLVPGCLKFDQVTT